LCSYHETLEVDVVLLGALLVAVENLLRKLWNVMPSVALSSDVEVVRFVLREALEPVEQEDVSIISGDLVAKLLQIGACVSV
jgi:hypothetical protein